MYIYISREPDELNIMTENRKKKYSFRKKYKTLKEIREEKKETLNTQNLHKKEANGTTRKINYPSAYAVVCQYK